MSISLDINYNKPSIEILSDLIYYTNGIRLDLTELNISKPENYQLPALGEAGDLDRNTKLSISGLKQGRRAFRGRCIVFYRRLDLNWLESDYEPMYINATSIRSIDLLEFINVYYGLQLSDSDIVDEVITKGSFPYKIRATFDSLVWVGESKINLLFKDTLVDEKQLSGFRDVVTNLIVNRKLDGFYTKHYQLLTERYLDGFQ